MPCWLEKQMAASTFGWVAVSNIKFRENTMINKLSKFIYGTGRKSRDAAAIQKAVVTGSPVPIVKRILNKLIGRHIVSKLWVR